MINSEANILVFLILNNGNLENWIIVNMYIKNHKYFFGFNF
jgi:hypothetical protein